MTTTQTTKRAIRTATNRTIEALEGRRLLSAVYHDLLNSNLSQNWETPPLFPADNDWSNVPSIQGFRGDGLASTNADATTVLGADSPGVINIDFDPTQAPATYGTGGLAQFGFTTPVGTPGHSTGTNTVAFQGSGTADAPYLKLYVNSTGVGTVHVHYDLIDIDPNANGAPQQVSLQYRVGNSGPFISVGGAGYTANAANTTANETGMTTTVDLDLPAAAGNAAQLELRILTVDATGTDQLIAIDNITVSGSGVVEPPAGRLSFESTAPSVGESDGSIVLTVLREDGSSGTISADYALISGTATAGSDFVAASGTVSFADGETSKTITVQITDDNNVEPTESFVARLTGAAVASGTSDATITITDNDVAGTIGFLPATYAIRENLGVVTLTLTRTDGSSGTATVDYTTSNASALAGSDYAASTGTVTFANGETTKQFTIAILDDSIAESGETFTVTLSNPSTGVILAATSATVTINDNDGATPVGLVLNEISINPPGTNNPFQYLELRGTPGQLLSNVYLLSIEGDTNAANPGSVNGILDLSAGVVGANGLLLVRSALPGAYAAENGSTGVLTTSFFDTINSTTGTGFQGGSNSFVLVYGDPNTSMGLSLNQDLDTTNGGTLALPSNLTSLDAVGISDGGTNDKTYGATLPVLGSASNASPDAPDAVSRFNGNLTPDSVAAWFYGNLSTATAYNPNTAQRSTNFPVGGAATPGGVLTTVDVVSFNYAGSGPQSLSVTFSEDVSSSLSAADFELVNTTASHAPVTLTLTGTTLDSAGRTVATLTFSGTGGIAPGILANGDYKLTVKANGVADAGGLSTLAADATSTFFFMNADFNHDRTVNFDDLLTLAQNYGTTSGATFARGDVNYDGQVNFDDLLALAQRYGTTLVQVAPAPAVATTAAKRRTSTYGQTAIV